MTASQALFDAGIAALEAGELERAATAFAQAVAAEPANTAARYRLANAYRDLHRLEDAEREIRLVIDRQPDNPQAHSALGVILMAGGRPAAAMAAYEAAIAADPAYVTAATNWVNAQHYVAGVTAASLARAHARWAALHAPERPAPIVAGDPNPHRPLRVGFVSPDLGRHPVGLLSVKVFENLNPDEIQASVFSTRPALYEDDISRRIARVTRWTSAFGLSDASLAHFIKASKIDILIDMTGHTGHGRMTLFAQRAAPVQAAWLGYPGTTGVPAMDYLLCTEALAPPGAEAFTVEKVARLPHTHACFDPHDAPAAGPPPHRTNGFITFGCFNNPVKISDDAVAAYARILTRVPGSKLKISYKTLAAPSARAHLHRLFERRGIAPDRLDLSAAAAHDDFLSAYNAVDIALDTFPYSGCMTTCEALWMGCPVVTFPGDTIASRQTAGILTAAGLSDLIAPDRAAFEDLAVDLAQDTVRLDAARAGQRARIGGSALCDGAGAARDFAQTLRAIWTSFCAAQNAAR